MLKKGIVSTHQLKQVAADFRWRGSPWIAFTLLKNYQENLSQNEQAELDCLYSSLPGGLLRKITGEGRYSSVDRIAVEEIANVYSAEDPIRVHDMGVSNGITSLAFYECLKTRFDVTFRASDLYDALYVVNISGSCWQVVFDAAGQPLQFVGDNLVIKATQMSSRERHRYPLNWLLQFWLKKKILPKAVNILDSASRGGEANIERIDLFHPECLQACRQEIRFEVARDDLNNPAPGRYDVLRVMGVILYGPKKAIEPMFMAVSQRVTDGGLLIVGAYVVDDDMVLTPTTIFRRRRARLVPVRRVDGGCPHEDRLLALDIQET